MSPDPNPNTQRYLDLLHSVLDIAHDIARDIHHQATTPAEPGTPKPDYTIPLERVTRTIRRTILLALKVAEPPKPERSRPKLNRAEARKRIIREVEDHIHRTIEDDEQEVAALQADLLDRLDSQELENELDTRPLPDIIIDIIRDLGLDNNWGPNRFKHRTQAEVAALAALAAEPLPSKPKPLRALPRRPQSRLRFPEDPRQAVAAILQMARLPDG